MSPTQKARVHRPGLTLGVLLADALQRLHKVGMFFDDIAGAFDRVETDKLLAKIRRSGICKKMIAFLENSLAPRMAQEAVDGE